MRGGEGEAYEFGTLGTLPHLPVGRRAGDAVVVGGLEVEAGSVLRLSLLGESDWVGGGESHQEEESREQAGDEREASHGESCYEDR